MKKFAKVLSVFVVCVLGLFALTSCNQKKSEQNNEYEVKAETGILFIDQAIENEKTVYHLYVVDADGNILADHEDLSNEKNLLGLFDSKSGKLYLENAVVPKGTYKVIYRTTEMPAVDNKGIFGDYFAGWYLTKDLRDAEGNLTEDVKLNDRVISLSVAEQDQDHILHAYYITLFDAILVAVVCIIIVFMMLVIIMALVMLLKFVAPKENKKAPEAQTPVVKNEPKKQLKIEDIKDEDMMVAALVATIDYHEETKEDVRVVSIKEIK